MKTILAAVFLLTSLNSFANSANKTTDTAEAVAETILVFEKDNDEQTVSDFKGIKAAPKDGGVSVTVYLNSGSKLKYGCHRHDSTDPFECHEK